MHEENRRHLECLIDRYLEQRRALNWSSKTIASYRSHLKVFTAYLATEAEIETIAAVTPDVLRRYQIYLYHWTDEAGRGRSFGTQGARLSAMRSFMRDLVRTKQLAHDPASTLELPKRRHILPRVILTKREVAPLGGAYCVFALVMVASLSGAPNYPPERAQNNAWIWLAVLAICLVAALASGITLWVTRSNSIARDL